MSENLKKHIHKFIKIDEQDYDEILDYFTIIEAPKKQNLVVEGKICKSNYFVSSGCLRMFFVNEKGVEQTVQFALENWWLADYTSFSSQKPSDFYIQAVERSELLALDFSSQEKMLQQFPQMERYFRLVHQRAHAAAQFRIKNLYGVSREELYHQFNKRYPEFVQRVPQYLLASFLGFTPEYLSEIRNKRIS
ncbi:MAG TPA: Crp/Fnr family transcriptional regulator [Flavipsychrobacter sp.]|nr:Crp/Fnr family transcriptional regulator [Flavipsychrobacter sp.]